LAAELRKLNPAHFDVVHAHTVFPDGLACALWLEGTRVPLVITAHGSDVHSMRPGVRAAMPLLLKRADRLIPVSRALGEKLVSLGADPDCVQIIPNGFTASLFNLAQPPPRDPHKIVFLGYLRDIKRVDLLLRAVAQCRPGIVLEVAGDGPERSRLQTLAGELGLRNRVTFLGTLTRDRVPAFLAGAALMCITSRMEGWPTILFEAMACGTPVLATAVGGIPEALEKPGLGRLVPADVSSEKLARHIETALAQSWDHHAIREHAMRFSWASIGEDLLRIYLRLTEARSSGPV
jgi:glycosyltransferase involved in cell wall biosynthesis